MSMRSSSGPESLARYRCARYPSHEQTRRASPANPHGHGFAAAIEREPRGELHGTDRARDDDAAVLERLAQALDRVAAELGELVEEQDAVRRERDLTRTQEPGAAAEQACRGDRVVRRAERRMREDPAPGQQAGHRVQLRGLEGLLPRERRQDRGEPPGEHGLAGAGRAHHEDVVTAGGGDLEGAPRRRLAAHLGQIDRAGGGLGRRGRRAAREAPTCRAGSRRPRPASSRRRR